jgi:CBS-domain-containing membrane protein
MVMTHKRFLDLTAADLMSRDVVAISPAMSLRGAAHRLAEAGVSGAPVVDAQGRCVGVLSTTDLVRWVDRGAAAARRSFGAADRYCADWEVMDLEVLPIDEVGRYMTTEVVTATPATRIGELARAMLDAHIHRIIVTDPAGRPVGILSATDVLAAVAAEDRRNGLSSVD